MLKETVIAIRVTLVTLVVTGLVYPLAVTGVAQARRSGPSSSRRPSRGRVTSSHGPRQQVTTASTR